MGGYAHDSVTNKGTPDAEKGRYPVEKAPLTHRKQIMPSCNYIIFFCELLWVIRWFK